MADQAHAIKICYIGGGSRQWATHLMADLALSDDITGELVLYDIDFDSAKRNESWGNQLFAQDDAKTTFAVRACNDLAEALTGADFVVMSIEPGPTEMRYADLEIPLQYGILQTVGDTVGPGGTMRAMRTIPIYMDFAHQIMAHCPQAWVINYTNPMTLCVSALYAAEPNIKAFGCCHEVFGTQKLVARTVERQLGMEEESIARRQDIKLDVCGINHFTWATSAHWEGRDLFPLLEQEMSQDGFFDDQSAWSQEQIKEEAWFSSQKKVAFDLFRQFGVLGAAGDRHLVEFVPWYLRAGPDAHAQLNRWGVLATPYSWRIAQRDKKTGKTGEGYEHKELKPSGEEGIDQIRALLGLCDLDTNVNLPNRGQMAQMPLGAVVETNAQFRRDSVIPVTAKALPAMPAKLVRDQVDIQQEVMAGMLAQDVDRLFQTVLCDPLTQIATDDARTMFDAMRDHTKDMLPEWLR